MITICSVQWIAAAAQVLSCTYLTSLNLVQKGKEEAFLALEKEEKESVLSSTVYHLQAAVAVCLSGPVFVMMIFPLAAQSRANASSTPLFLFFLLSCFWNFVTSNKLFLALCCRLLLLLLPPPLDEGASYTYHHT